MRKHKWRRRLVILILLIVLGVVVLTPDKKAERFGDDTVSAEPADSAAEIFADDTSDNRKEAMAVTAGQEEEKQLGEETIIGWMIDRVAAGEVELSDEDSIRIALGEAETELGISLTEDNKDKVVGFLQTLGTIGIETEGFIDQAGEKYRKYSAEFVEEANETINEAVENAVTSTAQNFFDSIRKAVGDFFKNLIPG